MSLRYIQLEEALGRPPEMKDFGLAKLQYDAKVAMQNKAQSWRIYKVISENIDEVWRTFVDAVETAKGTDPH